MVTRNSLVVILKTLMMPLIFQSILTASYRISLEFRADDIVFY